MKKLIGFLLLVITPCFSQIKAPNQLTGPSGSVLPRVFFGTTPNNVAGNKAGDFYMTSTALYLCTASKNTVAPACTSVTAGGWQVAGTFTGNVPDLTLNMSHSGNFTQGQTGATYTVLANNVGTAPTSGLVTVTMVPPVGITITALSGTGWTCDVLAKTCTRSDVLNGSASYPNISEVVTLSATAGTPLINAATIAGGGETNTSNNGATNSTVVNLGATPDLSIIKSHVGNFAQAQTGAIYSIVVTNVGGASTSGAVVTVTDTLPTGLTATAMAGTGWSCTFGTGICTRSTVLASNASYPTITYTVNVAADAQPSVTNTVSVAGGGESNLINNVSSDPTTITGSGIPVSDAFPGSTLNGRWTVLNPAGGTVTVSSAQAHLVVPGGANHDPQDSGMDQSLRIAQTVSNVNFQATVEFDSIPTTAFQFEGFFAKQDTNSNFMRFQIGSDGVSLHCNANVIVAGVSTDPIDSVIAGSLTKIWLRVTRVGDLWTEFYSLDGVGYNTCGTANQNFTINEFDIWGGNFNDDPTMSPAFTVLAANFVGATVGGGGSGGTCTTTITSVSNVQAVVTAASAGQTLCFSGAITIPSVVTLKPGITYTGAGALGTGAVLTSATSPMFKLAGASTTISNLVMNGGGLEITGSTTGLNFTGNIVRNINGATGFGPTSTGIFQDALTNTFLASSSIDHNQFTNIYGPGDLTCSGQFPASGQPCDYAHDGIDLYLVNGLTITQNIFNTISGDNVHLFEAISCADFSGTGPGGNQPNLSVTFNRSQFNHRIPFEFQGCHMTNAHIDSNLITGTYLPNAWVIQISFASDATGSTISHNYMDGTSSTGNGWGLGGECIEAGGTATVVDGNFCSTTNSPSGFTYFNHFTSVFSNAIAYSNNQYCGPSLTFGDYDPNRCGAGGVSCQPYTEVNDKYTVSCSGFPAQTLF